jgi:hypothetical protein
MHQERKHCDTQPTTLEMIFFRRMNGTKNALETNLSARDWKKKSYQ